MMKRNSVKALSDRIERLKAALKPFAYYYDLNDCKERDTREALEVPISDLRAAKRAIEAD